MWYFLFWLWLHFCFNGPGKIAAMNIFLEEFHLLNEQRILAHIEETQLMLRKEKKIHNASNSETTSFFFERSLKKREKIPESLPLSSPPIGPAAIWILLPQPMGGQHQLLTSLFHFALCLSSLSFSRHFSAFSLSPYLSLSLPLTNHIFSILIDSLFRYSLSFRPFWDFSFSLFFYLCLCLSLSYTMGKGQRLCKQ